MLYTRNINQKIAKRFRRLSENNKKHLPKFSEIDEC